MLAPVIRISLNEAKSAVTFFACIENGIFEPNMMYFSWRVRNPNSPPPKTACVNIYRGREETALDYLDLCMSAFQRRYVSML